MTTRLSLDEVRRLLLHAQGLTSAPAAEPTKADVLAAIRRMHALQIDTIHVVARSPYLVPWSRLGSYEARWLDELLAEGELFETWSHAACFVPAEHYGAYRRQLLDRSGKAHQWAAKWMDAYPELARDVLARIRDEGPLRSADFERSDGRKGGGWWDWKAEKRALEALFNTGELMVVRRERFQRVYDLTERARPDWRDAQTPSTLEARQSLIHAAVGALGVATPAWIANYAFLNQPVRPIVKVAMEMAEAGELEAVEVDGLSGPALALPGWVEQHRDAANPKRETMTTLLSPFDPVAWDRDRLAALFGFDYRIECYTPEAQRQYGYFCLPILHGDRMVGRLDPKAHRKEGVMEIRALHLEAGVEITPELGDGLRDVLHRFAAWHGTPEVVVRESNPASLKLELQGL